jgi:membrane-associated protease RseP (regulator of RpoE activity)
MAPRSTLSAIGAFNLRRAFPLIVVLTVLGCTYLQARALNALLSSWLLGSLVRPFVSPPQSPREPKRSEKPPTAITFSALVPTPASESEMATDCSDVRLSIVSELEAPEDSLATLTWTGDARARLRRRGDRVGNRLVTRIGTEPTSHEPAVWLEHESSAQTCRVDLFHAPRSLSSTEPQETVSPTTMPPPRPSSLRDLLGPVRTVPEREAGKLVGLRLFGVRPGSLLGQIGLRNGDRIDSINGYSIADPEQALLAYARLRAAEDFKLRVSRAGQPLEIAYHLTDSVRRQLVTSEAPN